MKKWKKISSIGDVNPIDHGGGFVFEDPEGGSALVEYFHGLADEAPDLDEDDPEYQTKKFDVYRVDLEDSGEEFLSQYDWVDWSDIAESTGQDVEEYSASNLATPQARAMAMWDAAGTLGWGEFDHYPLDLTIPELEDSWGLE